MEKITISMIDRDWRPIASNFYYAQRGDTVDFGFGRTATEALANLEQREASKLPAFNTELAEEIAFLALGASAYLREHQTCDTDFSEFGGYMGFISEVISQAPVLMHRWHQIPHGEFNGVWLYDVTERFGREWAEALFGRKAENPSEFLECIIVDEMQKWEPSQ